MSSTSVMQLVSWLGFEALSTLTSMGSNSMFYQAPVSDLRYNQWRQVMMTGSIIESMMMT